MIIGKCFQRRPDLTFNPTLADHTAAVPDTMLGKGTGHDESEDGVASLTKMRNSKFDIVVSDINMNGFQLLTAINQAGSLKPFTK